MINVLFHLILSLFMIIFQTVVLPSLFFFTHAFDLIIVNVLYLSLVATHNAVIFWILLLGCVMDSLSGNPLGVHLSAYLWIFFLVQLLKRYVHYGNVIFLPVISAVAVLLENLFLIFSLLVHQKSSFFSREDILLLAMQMFWAFWFAPIIIVFIHSFQKILVSSVKRIAEQGESR